MTYREAHEAIAFRHCCDTCDYDHCQLQNCEFWIAKYALNCMANIESMARLPKGAEQKRNER